MVFKFKKKMSAQENFRKISWKKKFQRKKSFPKKK